jgi:hypothetical protein
MDIVKIKTWIRSFAKQNKIWFESYDEIPEIPIEDMQTSFIEGKLYIEINQFYDITIGFFEYTKDIIEENVFVCKHKLFVWQLSDFSTEKSLFETIYRKIKIYKDLEQRVF